MSEGLLVGEMDGSGESAFVRQGKDRLILLWGSEIEAMCMLAVLFSMTKISLISVGYWALRYGHVRKAVDRKCRRQVDVGHERWCTSVQRA